MLSSNLTVPGSGTRPAHHHHHQNRAKAHARWPCACRAITHVQYRYPLLHCRNSNSFVSEPSSDKPHKPAAFAAVTRWEAPTVRAAAFTGLYATLAGMALTVAPTTVFGLLFDSTAVPSGWIRVGGVLFTLIGMQYLGTAWADGSGQGARGFYLATVVSRFLLVLAFTALVITQQCPNTLLVLAVLNLAGAVSMLRALQKEGVASPAVIVAA